MPHNIPIHHIQKHTKGISDAKRTQVSNLQTHIQEILGDSHHTFLQGSYKNDTSISDINDVDIVAIRRTTYSGTYSSVQFSNSILWDSIFTEIEQKLRDQKLYQWTVTRKDKCIEVVTFTFKADVVPAVQILADPEEDPIAIYSFTKGVEKVNSPRTHYKNGVAKHQATNNNYKPVVRMFKNWVANNFADTDVVSSYHIESLVHNVPNDNFLSDHALSFLLVGNHINNTLSQRNGIPLKIMSVCGTEDITSNWDINSRQFFNNKLKESLDFGLTAYKANSATEGERHWNKAFNL